MDCIFCKIVRGELHAEKVYEDEHAVAFLDIKPNNLGHVLLVPKEHARNVFDISNETFCKLVPPLKKISRAVKDATGASGINIAMNNEPSAGQIVFHAHLHIIPRFEGDSTEHKTYRDGEMREIAERIRSKI